MRSVVRRTSSVVGKRVVVGVSMSAFKSITEPWQPEKSFRCPCCKYRTLHSRGGFEVCPVCFWEDDGQDDDDADKVRGGPNSTLSLSDARSNFKVYGAMETRFVKNVRAPMPDEL